MPELSLFVSHSASDAHLAKALAHLVEKALKITARKIRCTSVDGYRLPVGTDTDERLRSEVINARAFIGLITPAAIESSYVMLELGARWGSGAYLAPVLAHGADALCLGGPLSGVNALRLDYRNEVVQLVEDLATLLDETLEPSASYQEAIDLVVTMAGMSMTTPAKAEAPLVELIRELMERGASSIAIHSIRIIPNTARLGTDIMLHFDVMSTLSGSVELWLGADVEYGLDQYFFVTAQDKIISVQPGRHMYSRPLTLGAPLSAGTWTLNGGLWLGEVSRPEQSVRLAWLRTDISILGTSSA